MRRTGIFGMLTDFFLPRRCVRCGCRLMAAEDILCNTCNHGLPRTLFHLNPKENIMAQRFWFLVPVENAAAFFFYVPKSETSKIVHAFKYCDRPDVAEYLGSMYAGEILPSGFFDGIEVIVPVPLARKRQRQRGYNQSQMIALGISSVTGIPVSSDAVSRCRFEKSQTHVMTSERLANVDGLFRLDDAKSLHGKHILVVDDVMTTGSTLLSCCEAIKQAGGVKISILTLGYTYS